MYKLILVDDEEEVRRGIIEKIDWEGHGFTVVGEAENGIEALEIAEKTMPDVVITDVKMPYMDGLALAEKLRELYPATKSVFLTGFDEFEFAQKAIKFNVLDYILKPVSSEEFIGILSKIKKLLDEEISKKKDIEMLREHYRQSLPLLRDKFLSSLVTGKLDRNDMLNKSTQYGLDMRGNGYVAAVLSIDSELGDAAEPEAEQPKDDGEPGEVSENRELLRFAALNISEEITAKYKLGITFIHNDNIVFIFCSQSNDTETFPEKCISILDEIRMYIEKYLEVTATIGMGRLCDDISQIRYSYENAVAALDYSLILSKNRVIYIEDLEPQNIKKVVFDELKERSLSSCIKVGTKEEISATVDSLFEEISIARISFKDYQIYLLEMLTTILKVAKDMGVDMDQVFGANYNLFAEIYRFKDLSLVKDWIIGICIKIKNYISRDRQDTCRLVVKRAIDFVGKSYTDSSLTIDKVCKHLHISCAYFSTIFKKETGVTFLNYLTNVRMETAKELLRTTAMKTFEVAEKVGFAESNYFSYCFKKNFGISPSEYRKSV